jgi:hypothetical protein
MMVYFDGLGGLIFLAVWIFCFIDVLVTPEGQCRSLPKLAWVFIVLLLPLIGSIGWLVAGHNWAARESVGAAKPTGGWMGQRVTTGAGAARPSNPDDDEEFLAGLRARAEEQRRRGREQPGGADPDRPHNEPS